MCDIPTPSPAVRYSVPPAEGWKLERLATAMFPSEARQCPAFLRHKSILLSPQLLKKHGVPFNRVSSPLAVRLSNFKCDS